MMANRGYDMTPTMYSPDGRIYQVEYALETVKRGTLAIGIMTKDGIVLAVEEKTRALQVEGITQKIFQVDDHIGVAAAGYIPDARVQVDNARYFSQSNKLTYDEPVDIETVAKHLADQNHQFTQYSGVRPFGVALIIAGMIDLCINFVPSPENFVLQIILAIVAVLTVGLGGGIYLVANLGPGARDGLMIGLQKVTNLPIAVVRAFIEISVVSAGWYLGGTVGIGTLLFAFGIGPAVALGLYLVDKIFNN